MLPLSACNASHLIFISRLYSSNCDWICFREDRFAFNSPVSFSRSVNRRCNNPKALSNSVFNDCAASSLALSNLTSSKEPPTLLSPEMVTLPPRMPSLLSGCCHPAWDVWGRAVEDDSEGVEGDTTSARPFCRDPIITAAGGFNSFGGSTLEETVANCWSRSRIVASSFWILKKKII